MLAHRLGGLVRQAGFDGLQNHAMALDDGALPIAIAAVHLGELDAAPFQ